MPQYKNYIEKNSTNGVPAGMLMYPALMAADILLYDADYVPVGADQMSHIDLCRDMAEKFNKRFPGTFKLPSGVLSKTTSKIMSLSNPTRKMSKSESDKGTIYLLDDIEISEDCINVEKFDAVLNGSGDILLQGMQCKGDVTLSVNGSGDIVLARELKAKSVKVGVNGSGDVRCEMITAYDVLAAVDGSGDVVLADVTSINCRLGVNGSGDLRMKAIKVEDVDASLTGSGDVVMSGVCDKAVLTLIGSGDISAKDLVAQDVTASVTSSGDITCNAQQNLVARVTGSGNIGYTGSPKLTINAKKGSVYAF